MKSNAKLRLVYLAVATVLVLFFVSCGNSKVKQNEAAQAGQDSVVVVEEETVVMVDSLAPDSTATMK